MGGTDNALTGRVAMQWLCEEPKENGKLKGPCFWHTEVPKSAKPHHYSPRLHESFGNCFWHHWNSADLLVKSRQTFHWEGEKLSAYLLRLDKLLHCVFRKGGVPLAEMNKLCIYQIVRGALPYDMVAFVFALHINRVNRLPSTTYWKRFVRKITCSKAGTMFRA